MKNPILAILALAFSASAWATCSTGPCLAALPTTAATGSVYSAFSAGSTSMIGTYRLQGITWSATNNFSHFADYGGFGLQHLGATNPAQLYIDSADTLAVGTAAIIPNFAGSTGNDISVQIVRDVTLMTMTVNVFDVQTGTNLGTGSFVITALASSATIKGNGIQVGGTNATGNISFMRWSTCTSPCGAGNTVAIGISSPANLVDYEFVGNLNDTSGNAQNLSGSVSSYNAATKYNPSCSAGAAQTVRVGQTITQSGAGSQPLDGGTTLTYSWSQLAGAAINGSTTSVSMTTVATSAFGAQNYQLSVTDGSSGNSICTVHDGAIIASANGVVNLTAEGLDTVSQKLIGPLIAYGSNPYPFADATQLLTLTQQISNLATYYTPYWRTSLGTATITAGSSTFNVGSGGLAPCGGTTSPSLNTASFIWKYTGTDSLTHYTYFPVTACTSSTVTVSFNNNPNYPASPNTPWPTCSSACSGGWNWGYSDSSTPGTYSPQYQWGIWLSPSLAAPGNYYDNAKSFYAMYWRTGIDTYLTQFQSLADVWWEHPYMDQGFNCYSGSGTGFGQNGNGCWAPAAYRSMAMDGVYLRALQQGAGSTKWSGIAVVEQLAGYSLGPSGNCGSSGSGGLFPSVNCVIDERETGYQMSILANCALASSVSGHSGCATGLHNTISGWTATQHGSDLGNGWGNFYVNNNVIAANQTSIAYYNGNVSNMSVCVVNGSGTVTGTNTVWTSAMNPGLLANPNSSGGNIWFFGGTPSTQPATNASGDSTSYLFTVTDNTHLSLVDSSGNPVTYTGTSGCTGTSGSNKGWVLGYSQNGSGFAGWGDQPVYDGHLAQAFYLAAQADPSDAATFNGFGDALVNRIVTYGVNPIFGGLYNNIFLPGCTPPIANVSTAAGLACLTYGTLAGTASSSRSLGLEAMRALAMTYQRTRSAATLAAGNALMTQMWCKATVATPNGGCTSDTYYISGFAPGGLYVSGTPPNGMAPKWAGQGCGHTEACDMWPGVVLGIGYAGPVTGVGVTTGIAEASRRISGVNYAAPR